jgi:hypothetical protein
LSRGLKEGKVLEGSTFMILALFTKVIRRLRGLNVRARKLEKEYVRGWITVRGEVADWRWWSDVRAPKLEITEYDRGVITVREAAVTGWCAESSLDGGDSVWYGYGATPFEALLKLMVMPIRMGPFHAAPLDRGAT